VEEVHSLTGSSAPLSRTASQAVGYAEVIEHLKGSKDLASTIALVKLHTRQLAKRQATWFRSLSECRFVPMGDSPNPSAVGARIADLGGDPSHCDRVKLK